MKPIINQFQTVGFDDEGSLHDALTGNGLGAQSVLDDLKRVLASGVPVIVQVPGMPPRALVTKASIERLTGTNLAGPDLVVVPFA